MAKRKLKIMIALFISASLMVACAGKKGSPVESSTEDNVKEEQMDVQGETPMVESPTKENGTNKDDANTLSRITLENLFPFEENRHRIYEGKGMEFVGYEEFVDFTEENKIQLRTNNGGTELVRIVERKDGELKEIFSEAEVYYVENFLSKKPKESRILLKEPLVVGTTWMNADVESNTITNLSAKVNTPLGDFNSLEVTRVSQSDGVTYTTRDYYAPEVGLVKTINDGPEYSFEASLKLDEKDAIQKKVMNFYYPNIDDERLFLYRKEISFKTNDIPRNLFLEAYKELPKEAGPVLTKNTKVNYLYLNDDGMVYIDLSSDFIKEMNAGAGYEGMILQSLVNTFGDYYGANKVMLTIEGKPYESGHVVLEKFEPLEVNYKSILNMN